MLFGNVCAKIAHVKKRHVFHSLAKWLKCASIKDTKSWHVTCLYVGVVL